MVAQIAIFAFLPVGFSYVLHVYKLFLVQTQLMEFQK